MSDCRICSNCTQTCMWRYVGDSFGRALSCGKFFPTTCHAGWDLHYGDEPKVYMVYSTPTVDNLGGPVI